MSKDFFHKLMAGCPKNLHHLSIGNNFQSSTEDVTVVQLVWITARLRAGAMVSV